MRRAPSSELFIVRHPNVVTDVFDCCPHPDAKLSESGMNEMKMISEYLVRRGVSKIWTSALPRTRCIRDHLNGNTEVEVIPDPLLNEKGLGPWKGKTWEEIQKEFPEEFAQFQKDPIMTQIPGGEDSEQFCLRVLHVLGKIQKKAQSKTKYAVIGHTLGNAIMDQAILRKRKPDFQKPGEIKSYMSYFGQTLGHVITPQEIIEQQSPSQA